MGFPAKKYDFRAWADGQPHRLWFGADYDTSELRFCRTAWMWADRHGYRLSFKRGQQVRCVVVQFTPGARREPGRPPPPPPGIHYPQRAAASSQRLG
jgi:hypothetical protein